MVDQCAQASEARSEAKPSEGASEARSEAKPSEVSREARNGQASAKRDTPPFPPRGSEEWTKKQKAYITIVT